MKKLNIGLLTTMLSAANAFAAAETVIPATNNFIVDHSHSPHTQLRPIPYDAVQWTEGFWADRYKQLLSVTLEDSWDLLSDPEAGHVLDNFRFAAKPGSGKYKGTTWQDEWLYKWIEAAACAWRLNRDPLLEKRMNEGIALIAAAIQPDGYLSTMPLAKKTERFIEAQDHEIYNMGHLLTAGIIHYRMTNKDNLLVLAKRTADFLCENLGKSVKPYMAHNPSAIMGLTEMYRLTEEKKYLECAQLIVDSRGANPKKQTMSNFVPGMEGSDVIQDRIPVRKSKDIVGHNVFFTYLYTGASDITAENGEDKLNKALGGLWSDMTERKMFITGGVSAIPSGLSNNTYVNEAAGDPYQLPNGTCYNETCGQIGAFMWSYRMLTQNPDSKYSDLMEREMYNGFLPAIGLEGKSWFYRGVLRRYDENYKPTGGSDMALRGKPGTKRICCPSNLLRTTAQLTSYFYNLDDSGVWIHQYGGSKLNCQLKSGETFAMEQVTDYPWSGDVKFNIQQTPDKPVSIRLRIPAWAETSGLSINGKTVKDIKAKNGYVSLEQQWKSGDVIALSLPMEAKLITADPRVEATRNQVAVMRGPVLYCVESSDLPKGIDVPSVIMPSNANLKPMVGLSGVTTPLAEKTVVLQGAALYRPDSRTAPLYRNLSKEAPQPLDLTLIPYYAWSNRGNSAMSIWIPVALKY